MLAVSKSLASRFAPFGARALATVGPGAVLHSAGSAHTPSEQWLADTAARKTPFDNYAFAYVCGSVGSTETPTRLTTPVCCLLAVNVVARRLCV